MATKQAPPTAGRSKIRLFVVDADLAPGDMRELTSALTNAMRPTHAVARTGQLQQLPAPANGGNGTHDVEDVLDDAVDETEVSIESQDDTESSAKSAARRTYRTPKPVEMNMSPPGQTSWQAFATEKGPQSHHDKYLVAAVWLSQVQKLESFNSDHIFTCYKSAGWTFDVADPALVLRHLKREGFLVPAGRGKFATNHLGVSAVEKMKPA